MSVPPAASGWVCQALPTRLQQVVLTEQPHRSNPFTYNKQPARVILSDREKALQNEIRENFRADDQPPERLPALSEHARCGRNKDSLIACARRAVQSKFCADKKRPWLLRRVRPSRRGRFRGRIAPTP